MTSPTGTMKRKNRAAGFVYGRLPGPVLLDRSMVGGGLRTYLNFPSPALVGEGGPEDRVRASQSVVSSPPYSLPQVGEGEKGAPVSRFSMPVVLSPRSIAGFTLIE